jgi:hypothetical protein
MLRTIRLALFTIGVLAGALAADVSGQVKSVPLPNHTQPTSIVVIFSADVVQMDGAPIPLAGGNTAPSPSIYFKEAGKRVYLTADAAFPLDSTGAPLLKQIQLVNFKTLDGSHAVDLVTGSDDGGTIVPPVGAGSKRAYFITWESVRLETQSQPSAIITVGKVGARADNAPSLAANLRPNKREFSVASPGNGISAATLLAKFQSNPGKVNVVYEFDNDDPAADFTEPAASVGPASNPTSIVVGIGRTVPHRPEAYTIRLEFPAADLRGSEEPGFLVPVDQEFVSAEFEVNEPPPSTERAKTEFFFDSTFTSVVNAKTRERSKVGLFGLHIKPTLPMLTYNVSERNQKPWWVALRPLFDADVDTQPIADSEAPNRIVFGSDLELGRDAGSSGANNFLQQMVWINGAHYDSDRDFKLQTLYWHTELIPYFRDWAQSRERRLHQFRAGQDDRKHRFPFVSSYKVAPSVGYQLGGFTRRDARSLPGPTDNISRLFVKFSSAIEFRRLLQFSLDDTYYFLASASRRRNRNYLETRLDFNTGALFNVDLGSLQSALTFKFQRGELPPSFKPVNAFSMGFSLYR